MPPLRGLVPLVLTLLHRYRPYGAEEVFYKEARIQSSPAGGGADFVQNLRGLPSNLHTKRRGYNPRQRGCEDTILASGGARIQSSPAGVQGYNPRQRINPRQRGCKDTILASGGARIQSSPAGGGRKILASGGGRDIGITKRRGYNPRQRGVGAKSSPARKLRKS